MHGVRIARAFLFKKQNSLPEN